MLPVLRAVMESQGREEGVHGTDGDARPGL